MILFTFQGAASKKDHRIGAKVPFEISGIELSRAFAVVGFGGNGCYVSYAYACGQAISLRKLI